MFHPAIGRRNARGLRQTEEVEELSLFAVGFGLALHVVLGVAATPRPKREGEHAMILGKRVGDELKRAIPNSIGA